MATVNNALRSGGTYSYSLIMNMGFSSPDLSPVRPVRTGNVVGEIREEIRKCPAIRIAR
jgi:hypothetical protein